MEVMLQHLNPQSYLVREICNCRVAFLKEGEKATFQKAGT